MRSYGLPLGLMVLLAACTGADDGSDERVDEASQALTRDQMALEVLILETALLDDTQAKGAILPDGSRFWVPRPLYNLLHRWGAPIARDCVKVTRWVDRDFDGLPYDARATLDCTSEANGTVTRSTGEVRVIDLNDHADGAGYQIKFEDLTISEFLPGATLTRTKVLDGWARVHVGDPQGEGSPDRYLELTTTRTAVTDQLERTLTIYTDTEYLPDNITARADPFGKGYLRVRGRWILDDGARVEATSVFSEGLHFDRACANRAETGPAFDRGSLRTFDDSGVSMRLFFEGCANWSMRYQVAY